MSTAPHCNLSSESSQGSIRRPHWRWCLLWTVLLVFIGTVLRIGVPICRQQAAIREIELLGGKVEMRRNTTDWLRRLLGDDWGRCLDDVAVVSFFGCQIADDDLHGLNRLTRIERLWLGGNGITNAGLEHLRELTSLETLDLWGTRISDAGLAHVGNLPRLKTLYLDQTQVTDAGLKNLKGLRNLRHLYCSDSRISDQGIADLMFAIAHMGDELRPQ
jgi:hypothetical protein